MDLLPFLQVGDSEWSKPFSMDTVGVNQVRCGAMRRDEAC